MPQHISTSSGLLAPSAGAQVTALESTVSSIQITPAAAISVLTVYDGTSTSGIVVASVTVPANAGTIAFPFNVPVVCNKGIFYSLTGAASTAVIHYVPGT